MLSDISFCALPIDIFFFHHECWDGLGYPEVLKGEENPQIGLCFLAIVDQSDALSLDARIAKAGKGMP